MSDIKKSVNLLPEFLRSDKNSKFLASTIDQLIQTPQVERVDGFVGSKLTPTYNPLTDSYLTETSELRNRYTLEPALVLKDSTNNITDIIAYDDLINELKNRGGVTDNLDKLFRSKTYSFDPLIDWDKLVNFTDYCWLPTGPIAIQFPEDKSVGFTIDSKIVGQPSYTMSNGYALSNGMKILFSANAELKYRNKEYIVEGVGNSIVLVEFESLSFYGSISTVLNETYDTTTFDTYSFDADRPLPLTPEYITINKASNDANPWSQYNRWFHKDVIKISNEINNIPNIIPLQAKAKRPIIEFRANLKLHNFGSTGIQNIDLIDTSTTDAFAHVHNLYGYYIDGVKLQQGHRVIFNSDDNYEVRGKIYKVTFDITGATSILKLIPELVYPAELNSLNVKLGSKFAGTSWYFDGVATKWIYAQQHTTINQPPLFDLFTSDGISYTKVNNPNNFIGNQIFGYEIGTGNNDSVLGFPLKYQNNGKSYLFKNYFMTDVISITQNNIASTIPTGNTFLKLDNTLVNVWTDAVEHKIPIIEIQTIVASTTTLILTCLDAPISTNISIFAYVNNVKIPITVTNVSNAVIITNSSTFAANEVVLLKIYTDQLPNSNGYYEAPIGLSHNPLNEFLNSLTLGELKDHLTTMINNTSSVITNNLRDISDYTKYGSRLVINDTPMAFAQFFFGKKEHNVVDAIRQAGADYDRFKLNFLRVIKEIDSQLTAPDALDLALSIINDEKDIRSLYRTSDMLGYGKNKIVRTITVTDVTITSYPISFSFDINRLSFQSVIIYRNGVQLIGTRNEYFFDYDNNAVIILLPLALKDVISIHCYLDTTGCYIPPTPSKLGMYPAAVPTVYVDTSVTPARTYILGHDSSSFLGYGDYRDNIILEYEKRVYNNIKVRFNNKIFDSISSQPGAFRNLKYTFKDFDNLIENDFSTWCGTYGIDSVTNDTFDVSRSTTWNYSGTIDTLFKKPIPISMALLYFYDTARPHTSPWRMLGFFDRPRWWVPTYGNAPYRSTNTLLWTDLENGYVRGTNTYLPRYTRLGLSSILPVDINGNLKNVFTSLAIPNTYTNNQSNWKFGDNGPAEASWRNRNSNYPFAVCAALAVIFPVEFCSTQYDLSRTTLNAAGQVIYNGNYLNLKNLVIAGENDNQIAGYGVYIAENGQRVDSQYNEKLRQDLDYLNINLFHKLGGFASKDKLQITIDSIDPKSTSPGVILPSEDYSLILNVSNPIVTARISGIIVQRSKGNFKIKGYDVKHPYFEILKPIKISTSGAVRVGGVSEEFTEWSSVVNNGNNGLSSVDLTSASSSTTRYYKQGQLVRYNNRFYRVKTGHNAETSFDLTLYQQLPELPVKGGASAQISKTFENIVTKIPYGTEFSSVQEIYDVIIGYGAFLEKQGFIFDDFNSDLNEILNWKLTGKEFLYWTTQNFADGNLITLSPFANSLKYNFPNSVVDDISGKKYEYSLLKADGKPYPIDRFTMSREDTICTIKTRDANEGLFFAVLHSVQKEHAMVFNNYTVFNDTIYDITTGYKQQRIKLSGFRTKNWNGDLFSPGFVFDDVNITDWQSYKMYLPGSIVRYNGKYYQSLIKIISSKTFDFTKWTQLPEKPVSKLLPNFDYKVDQFEDFYSLDIDNFDSGQQQLAQHLTGYTPRSYLNNIFTNPISQYKFYQGLIKDKGTKNALDKLSKAGQFSNKGELSFNEEWAFRIGHYGSFETFNEIEFTLTEGTSLENPYVVKFVDTIPSDANPLINHVVTSDLLLTPNDYSASNAMSSMAGTLNDNNIVLTTAGYVRLDDVTTTAYSKNSLLDIANNAMIQDGVTVWLGFLENGDWAVYRYTKQLSKITGVFVSAPTIEITFVTDGHHNLNIGDIISVVRFNEQVNGVYIVSAIPTINQFAVKSTLASIENAELINYGGLYRFENARYSNLKQLSEITDLLKLNAGDKVWIDSGTDNKWQVYEKIKNYDVKVVETAGQPLDQEFGSSVWASDNSSVMLVSSPNWHTDNAYSYGRVKVYNQIKTEWKRQYDYILNANNKTYADPTSVSDFGHAIQYDIGKKLYITGAPLASSIRSHSTGTGTVILSTGSGLIKSWSNEGLVKIISRAEDHGKIDVNIVLVNPYGQLTTTATNSKFGYSIAINQVVATTATTLLVGAPGSSTGYVFAYKLNLTTATNATATITGFSHSTNVLSVRPPITLTLSTGSYWGHKIAGSLRGFAISAPAHNTSTGVVQTYNNDLQPRQTITSPFGLNGKFGHDIAISNDAMYMIISAPYARGTNEPYGKVAVYKNLGNLTDYLASRPEVILALATNISAPVYYGEVTILNWMTAGLTGFNQYWINYRASHPADAAIYDAERAVDAVIKGGSNAGVAIVDSRARVIAAYQNHPDAQLYPSEPDIRYWMENGLGSKNNVINSRQLAGGLGGARRSTDINYELTAVTLDYAWNDFMNSYAIWNADGTPTLNFTTSVSFNRSGIFIFELAADNYASMYVDNINILSSYGFTNTERREIYVPQGTHTIRIGAYNSGGPAGLAFKITSDIAFTNTDTSIFDASVVYNNILYPNEYARNIAERAAQQATFQLDQIITNPLLASDLKFGYSVSISKDNTTIGIGALGKNRTKVQPFDITSNIGETTFDNSSTKFYDNILDGGTVYLYNKVGDKFIQADELNDVNIISGSKYGSCLAVTNNNVFVGAPASDLVSNVDKSKFYIFNKIDTTSQSWKLLRTQEDTVDVSGINRISLIDTLKEEVIEYLDVIDPLKGKIAGIADQELTYRAASDPATYSIGLAGTIVDSSTSWIDDHIGELWWDLSTVKYQWYEQGDDIFRKNNWGKLFPGASIDVYEWVKSYILPSEWAAQADTNKGLINGISGQPKYVNNSSISIKQLFNNVTGSFENVYYFWVKNKVTLPGTKNRRLSAYQVASYIADPVSNGLKFIEILSPSAIAFANVQPLLIGNRINANISTDNRSSIPRHTEWLLLNENNANSVPNTLLEKKLFDSLIGHDSLGNSVPDPALTDRNRYGVSIRPRQTLFKNRIEALRSLVSFVNSVFLKNRIVGIYEFTNLNKKEEIPVEFSNEYDALVEDIEILAEIETIKYQRAEINCYADNGKIKSVSIIDAGFGYINPPKINILTNSSISAEFVTEIDSYGRLSSVTIINAGVGYPDGIVRSNVRPHTVIVEINSESGNRWTKHEFDYIKQVWVKTHTQKYNTTLFWKKIDWKADTFNNFKIINHTISDLFALASFTGIKIGDYLKVKNSGDGSYIILEKVQDSGNFTPLYNIIYKENGTIRLRDTLWNYNLGKYAYDKSDIDETLYDERPDLEIYYILVALRDNIFINDLKINWNLFFFTAVKYALTEQKLLDWAFKTSFINVTNNVGSLNQQPVYQLNNESYFEDYINEIKPYRTKIRSYSSIYKNLEQADLSINDFDFPSVYNENTNNFDIVSVSADTTGLIDTSPWKDWKNNYKLHVGSIKVGYAGSGYTQRPIVSIVTATGDTGSGATAEAYIRNGSLYEVIVTNPGSGYTTTPKVIITGGGQGVNVARVSVIMNNNVTRANTIGMKFDRVSLTGNLTQLNTSDEFICDGTTNKFILSWLPAPDKTTIVPLLDGKLVFATDYTIEYYEVATTKNTSNDVAKLFPINSWKGESSIDHRYRYYTSVVSSSLAPSEIQHYARFVFLNQIPNFGQIFKISYNKNIKLYNAIDRISAAYNPTNSMPGKELPLLMTGAEFPGLLVQGLTFNQTSNWDSVGTPYDSIPWNDAISDYTIVEKYYSAINVGSGGISLTPTNLVVGMQVSVVGSQPGEYFRKNTLIKTIQNNAIELNNIIPSTYPIKVYSSGTAYNSTVTIVLSEPIGTSILVGDLIQLVGVHALYGNGITALRINTKFTTTGVVSITIPAPYFNNGTTATFTAVKTENTVTGFTQVGTYSMGYSYLQLFDNKDLPTAYMPAGQSRIQTNSGLYSPPRLVTQLDNGGIIITSTAPIYWDVPVPFDILGLTHRPDVEAILDNSFSVVYPVDKIINDNTIITRLVNGAISSTASAFVDEYYRNPDGSLSKFKYEIPQGRPGESLGNIGLPALMLFGVIKRIPTNGRLLEYINTITVASTSSVTIQTGVYYDSAQEAKIVLSSTSSSITTTGAPGGNSTSGGSVEYSTWPLQPYDNPIVYNITTSTDGKNRAVVTVYSLNPSARMVSGTLQVSIYGNTQLEFWKTDPGKNSLIDSSINELYPTYNLQASNYIGYNPEDIIIDGNNFLNAIDSYAPEECVPGHVRDSVGISVYTASTSTTPMVISGVIGVLGNTIEPTRAKINLLSDNEIGALVFANGIKFDRVPAANFTTNTQYAIIGDQIVIPIQPRRTLVEYTFITAGSNVIMDSNFTVTYTSLPYPNAYLDIVVESSLNINDVRSVYVLVNGNEIAEAVTNNLNDYGYKLKPMSSTNNRASIHIQGVQPGGSVIVQAWFFNKPFVNFNRVHEQLYTTSTTTTNILLDSTIGNIQPVSDKVIVEIITPSGRTRLSPPWVAYYKINNSQYTFAIDPINYRPSVYTLDNVKVFLNGKELRPGFDFSINGATQTFTITRPNTVDGDAIAVMPLLDYEYIITNNKLTLSSAISTGTVKITSFTNHDNMMINTEKFSLTGRSVTLNSYILSDTYVWVTLNNQWLIANYDYKVLSDYKTIVFADSIETGSNSKVIVTIVNPPSYGNTILGYRMFYDMFNRHYFARLSTYFSTRLAQPLQYTDTSIIVEDGDHLFQPNPSLRLPGVILLDGERIEYTSKNGNQLTGLRRGSLGTGPPKFSDQYTTVIDQSITQKIKTEEYINIQRIESSNTNTYIISTLSNTLSNYSVNSSGDVSGISLPASVANFYMGITLLTTSTMINPPAAIDQVEVRYGGRLLRKTSIDVHDKSLSYYSSKDSIIPLPPEFSIITATQTLILNIDETITTGTTITVIQRLGKLWEENTSTSLLSNATSAYITRGNRAEFLRERPAQLPDIYYYGGDKILYDSGLAMTDENGENLEGY